MSKQGKRPIEEMRPLIYNIRKLFDKKKITHEICGSVRRKETMIGDLDFIVNGKIDDAVYALRPLDTIIIVKGKRKARLNIGDVCVELNRSALASWGAALVHFTGNGAFDVALRIRARDRGFKLNEYGVWRETHMVTMCETEQEVFDILGVKYVPPEQRKWSFNQH
jgi:DNA polymerase (family X)